MLKTGAVEVNGQVKKDGKLQIDPVNDQIYVLGEYVEYRENIYIMMNKPKGVISATEDLREKCVVDLLDDSLRRFEPFPVGRLDKDTVGLLILTNDGKLAHELLAPKKKVAKRYWAKIEGLVNEEDVRAFEKGVVLDDGYVTKPAQLSIISGDSVSEIEVTIVEGKFHQVKRMFQAVGKRVLELKRIQMGALSLDEQLKLGEYRELTNEELTLLQSQK